MCSFGNVGGFSSFIISSSVSHPNFSSAMLPQPILSTIGMTYVLKCLYPPVVFSHRCVSLSRFVESVITAINSRLLLRLFRSEDAACVGIAANRSARRNTTTTSATSKSGISDTDIYSETEDNFMGIDLLPMPQSVDFRMPDQSSWFK